MQNQEMKIYLVFVESIIEKKKGMEKDGLLNGVKIKTEKQKVFQLKNMVMKKQKIWLSLSEKKKNKR